jgi:hypothetical protein
MNEMTQSSTEPPDDRPKIAVVALVGGRHHPWS